MIGGAQKACSWGVIPSHTPASLHWIQSFSVAPRWYGGELTWSPHWKDLTQVSWNSGLEVLLLIKKILEMLKLQFLS